MDVPGVPFVCPGEEPAEVVWAGGDDEEFELGIKCVCVCVCVCVCERSKKRRSEEKRSELVENNVSWK